MLKEVHSTTYSCNFKHSFYITVQTINHFNKLHKNVWEEKQQQQNDPRYGLVTTLFLIYLNKQLFGKQRQPLMNSFNKTEAAISPMLAMLPD